MSAVTTSPLAGSRASAWPAALRAQVKGAVILFCTAFFLTLFSDLDTGLFLFDKSWFLHVVDRVSRGEVLYRDTFFGVSPLSIYLTLPFTVLFGNAFIAALAWWTVWLVGLILVTMRAARQLGCDAGSSWLLAGALVVFMTPWLWSPYSLLAALWLLVCFLATLAWQSAAQAGEPADRWLIAAGLAAGLCLVSKQNFGAYVIAALGGTLLCSGGGWANRRNWPRYVLLTAGPVLMVTVLALLPVVVSGGGPKFIEYIVGNKPHFIRTAQVSFFDAFADIVVLLTPPFRLDRVEHLYWRLAYLLPPLACIVSAFAWFRAGRPERPRAAAVILFAVAAILGVYPRATLPHLVVALPMILLALAYALVRLAPSRLVAWGRPLRAAAWLWLLLGAGVIVARPVGELAAGEVWRADLPHFRGFPVTQATDKTFRTAERLAGMADQQDEVFILSLRAGFLYLASGLRNPTPYDYPLHTAFGWHGQDEVRARIANGELRSICVDHDFSPDSEPSRLRPRELLLQVASTLEPRRDVGTCVLYRPARSKS